MIADINDVQLALDMEDATAVILGYLPNNVYDLDQAEAIKQKFNNSFTDIGLCSLFKIKLPSESLKIKVPSSVNSD